MRLPFQIYDFIGILFPGVITIMIIMKEAPHVFIWNVDNQYGTLAGLFVVAYIIGHLIQGINRIKFVTGTMQWIAEKLSRGIRKSQGNGNGQKQAVLEGRHYKVEISSPLKNQIDFAVEEVYGIKPETLTRDELFNLIYTPVADRLGQRHVFVAIANFLRAMGLVSLVYVIWLLGKTVYIIQDPHLTILFPQTIGLITIMFFSFIVFVKNAHYFKQFTDVIPYFTFLSWYKEMKIRQHN
ncbi:MAG: hypothetical protein K6T65_11875 [Peptococcaceae bacterium]|nr:hypothetical protein [Peptococcaceae bacterium]